jgi:NUMOD4 motif/HNH endonuclease
MPADEPERWLPVVGYEGLYEISSLGRVRNVPRLIRSKGKSVRRLTPCILKFQMPRKGEPYLTVRLRRGTKVRACRVHVLVARAFLGPRPEKYVVCHGPAGKLDNRLPNLSYGTRAKNQGPDMRRDGTSSDGARNGHAKLTGEIVLECRVRAAAGETGAALAAEFGVNAKTLRDAISGRSWRRLSIERSHRQAA